MEKEEELINYVTRDGIACHLEIGKYRQKQINDILQRQWRFPDVAKRFEYIMNIFNGAGFIFEPSLDVLPVGIVRIKFDKLDCITFIYHAIAMLISTTFDDYISHYVKVRYRVDNLSGKNLVINNDSYHGNIFDFVCESLLLNAVQRGYLENINADLCPRSELSLYQAILRKQKRSYLIDKNENIITPKFGDDLHVSHEFILSDRLKTIDSSKLRTGDIAILTKFNSKETLSFLVSHVIIVYKENTTCRFIHAGKNYIVKPGMQQKPLEQQIGVNFGLKYAGDEYTYCIDGISYYGYTSNEYDEMFRYIASNFSGVSFLRIPDGVGRVNV